ncbi:hypothetical protein SKAU_G00112390 [Synaphobranchus kaupii]|uniref:Uncharacterized protein n=1 Tax=Synaphobranchus kaupii TaxID=118154 RepID=A0A9Q1G1U7_SYNKA|nr:hypothetical protein SKAU_G00112390 [Synaphobranchus kaupii]
MLYLPVTFQGNRKRSAQHLGLKREEDLLTLRTIRQDVVKLRGDTVSFEVSVLSSPQVKHHIRRTFTADKLNLAEQSCAVASLKKRYGHLREVPLQTFSQVQPMLLIGSDHANLITPIHPIRVGPSGAPVAVCTQTWKKEVTRSKLDQETVDTLEKGTVHLTVDGILRNATPLLRKKLGPSLWAAPAALLPLQRATERRPANSPELASVYNREIRKLVH